MITTPIIAMKTNSPAIAGTKNWSAADGAGVGATVGVAVACITVNAVVADDGQYPLVPAKCCGDFVCCLQMSGVQTKLYLPVASVVAVPMVREFPFASTTVDLHWDTYEGWLAIVVAGRRSPSNQPC